jgi:hypothetical protein
MPPAIWWRTRAPSTWIETLSDDKSDAKPRVASMAKTAHATKDTVADFVGWISFIAEELKVIFQFDDVEREGKAGIRRTNQERKTSATPVTR